MTERAVGHVAIRISHLSLGALAGIGPAGHPFDPIAAPPARAVGRDGFFTAKLQEAPQMGVAAPVSVAGFSHGSHRVVGADIGPVEAAEPFVGAMGWSLRSSLCAVG